MLPEPRVYALTPADLLIAELIHRGTTTRDICAQTGITAPALHNLKNTPDFHAYLTEIRAETLELSRNKIESETLASVEKIVDLRDFAENPRLRFDAARDILDRAGLKAPERHIVKQESGLTGEMIDLLRDILREAREVESITVTEVRVLPERAQLAELTNAEPT